MRHAFSRLAIVPVVILFGAGTVAGQKRVTSTPIAGPAAITKAFTPPCGIESQGFQQITAAITTPGPMAMTARSDKQLTQVSVPYLIGVMGQTMPLKASLTFKPEGSSVPNHTIFFRVDGQLIGTAKTDGQGNAQLQYTVPYVPGVKTVEAKYLGSDTCTGSKGENTLNLTKASTKITLQSSVPSIARGGQLAGEGKLTSVADGKGVDGREVIVSLDGQPQPALATSPSGRFVWQTAPLETVGNHTVQASFAGDNLYVASTGSLGFAVVPPPVPAKLNWDSVEGQVGETKTVTAKLRRTGGIYDLDPLHNGIPGVTIGAWYERGEHDTKGLGTAVTDGTGTARIGFKIDDKPRGYFLRAAVNGLQPTLDVHYPSTNETLTVHQAPVKLTVAAPASARIGDTIYITVMIIRTTDGAPLASVEISMIGAATKTTSAAGLAILSLTVGATGGIGPRTFTAYFSGTAWYLPGNGSATINVLPKVT